MHRALKRLFEPEGYVVQAALDGPSGVESFRTTPPSAVVLDMRLPGMTGRDVCREMKQICGVRAGHHSERGVGRHGQGAAL